MKPTRDTGLHCANLSFATRKDIESSEFWITSGHGRAASAANQLTGDAALLYLADNLGKTVVARVSIAQRYCRHVVNLKTGKVARLRKAIRRNRNSDDCV